jgi:hypothetical protein
VSERDLALVKTKQGVMKLKITDEVIARAPRSSDLRPSRRRQACVPADDFLYQRRHVGNGRTAGGQEGGQGGGRRARRLEEWSCRQSGAGDRIAARADIGRRPRELISEVFEFVEGFYNTRRRQSTLGHLLPAQFETMTLTEINKENGHRRKPVSVPGTGSTPVHQPSRLA